MFRSPLGPAASRFVCVLAAIANLACLRNVQAQAVGTAFTFQGELAQNGGLASGAFDLRFALFDASTGGTQVGSTLCVDNMTVAGGKVTASLDFGAQYDGQRRYLQVLVRTHNGLGCADGTGYTALTPRQELSAVPYASTALTATSAATLGGQPPSFYMDATHLTGSLPGGALTGSYTGVLNLTNTNNTFVGSGAGLTQLNATSISSGVLASVVMPMDWAAGGDLVGLFPNVLIAPGAVTDDKIASVAWNKITGVPADVSSSPWVHSGGPRIIMWGFSPIMPQPPAPPSGLIYMAVSAGSSHCVATLSDGSLVGWGDNSFGQANVPSGRFMTVAAGDSHDLAIRDDASVVAWGSNNSGQTDVPAMTLPCGAVAAGGSHSLALLIDGSIVAWGSNGSGQLNVPPPPPGPGGAIGIAAGEKHSLAVYAGGVVLGWGNNDHGQCDVPPLPDGMQYQQIAAGQFHSVALRSDGMVIAWGANGAGQTNVPPLPPGLLYTGVTAGDSHSMARRSDGSIVGWGGTGSPPSLANGESYGAFDGGSGFGVAVRYSPEVLSAPTGLSVAGDSQFHGNLSAVALTGDGAGLTNVAALSAITAQIAQTAQVALDSSALEGHTTSFFTDAGNLTGTVADDRLSAHIPRLDSANVFTGPVTALAFSGSGAGLTGVLAADSAHLGGHDAAYFSDAGNLTSGILPSSRLPATAARLDTPNNAFTGTLSASSFSGSGAGLTGVDAALLGGRPSADFTSASNLTSGTLSYARLPAGIVFTGGPNAFGDYTNTFAGHVGIGTTSPSSPLTVQASGYGFSHTDGTTTLGTYIDGGGGWVGTLSNNALHFFVNNGATAIGIYDHDQVEICGGTATSHLLVKGNTDITGSLSASQFVGMGSGLTGLNAGAMGTGTLADARLSSNVPLKNAPAIVFAGSITAPSFAGSGAGLTDVNATLLGGLPIAAYARSTGPNTFGNYLNTFGGAVGVGTAVPTGRFEVMAEYSGGSAALDQEQAVFDSAAGGPEQWQSFTAGRSGYLTRIDLGVSSPLGGSASPGTIYVYAGQGTAGVLLTTQNVTYQPVYSQFQTFDLNDPPLVVAGQQYTIRFTCPASHTSWVDMSGTNPYAAGRADLTIIYSDIDYRFRTYVAPAAPNSSLQIANSGEVSVRGSLTAGSLAGNGASITNLTAMNLTGPVPAALLQGVDGSGLVSLNGSRISSGTVGNAFTTGTSANTINTLVLRDGSGNFSAGTITAALHGNATTATTASNAVLLNNQAGAFYTNAGNLTGTLPTSVLTGTYSGAVTFSSASNSFNGSGAALTNLNATNLGSGTIPDARLTGTYTGALVLNNLSNSFTGSGAGLIGVNAAQLGGQAASFYTTATNLASGTVPDARLSANVPLKNAANAFGAFTNSFAGSVGIGTTSPTEPLDVVGRARITGPIQSSTTPITTTSDMGLYSGTGGAPMRHVTNGGAFSFYNNYANGTASTGLSPVFVIAANGSVGVGTASPATALHVQTPAGGSYGLQHTDGTYTLATYLSSVSNTCMIGTRSSHSLSFFTGDGPVQMSLSTGGNLNVVGTISKGGGTFKIDHPLDPENKYLYHSFVESPDMMNVYNGNATTDGAGFAVIELPDYFEALNKDFRYQVTVIDENAPDAHFVRVFSKIGSGGHNRFTIKSTPGNLEVSWQVTGVRKDAFANKNRVIPEVDKAPSEKGKYLHPDAFNIPAERGIFQPPAAQNLPAVQDAAHTGASH